MHFTCPAPGWLSPCLAPTSLATVLIGFFVAGCHDGNVPSDPGPTIITPLSAKDKGCPDSGHPSCDTDSGNAQTFYVTIWSDVGGNRTQWTDGAQHVQSADKVDWLHVFDSGGKGTRGNPNYANAAFSTNIFMQPALENCEGDASLWDKFDQAGPFVTVVFDFQTDYDIGEPGQEDGPSFFLFRWEQPDGRVFSVGTGFAAGNQGPSIYFLGDDIRDATVPRTFRIVGGAVVAKELRKNRVLATYTCVNDREFEVTVAP